MRERVQAETPEQSCGVVAQTMSAVRVHELVHGDPEDDRDHERDEADRIVSGALHRQDEPTAQPAVQEKEESEDEQRVDAARTAEVAPSTDHSMSSLGNYALAMRPRNRRRRGTRVALHRKAPWTCAIAAASAGVPATWMSAMAAPRSTRSPTFACSTMPVR